MVGHPGGERSFRPDDNEVDLVVRGDVGHRLRVGRITGDERPERREAGVAGEGDQTVESGTLSELPPDGMLAAALPEEQNLHWASRLAVPKPPNP